MQPLSVWSILSGQEAVMSSRWETLKRGGCALGQTEKGCSRGNPLSVRGDQFGAEGFEKFDSGMWISYTHP